MLSKLVSVNLAKIWKYTKGKTPDSKVGNGKGAFAECLNIDGPLG